MSDEKALTVAQPAPLEVRRMELIELQQAIESNPDYIPGSELVERDDLPFAQIKLMQGTGVKPAELGKWKHTITGVADETFTGVLLSFAKHRAAFDEFGSDTPVLCASDDALYPRKCYIGTIVEGVEITGNPCVNCPLSKFGTNGEAPFCSKCYSFALLDKDFKIPVVATMKKSGVKSARILSYLVKYPTAGRHFFITLGVTTEKDKKGREYYVPTIEIGDKTDDETRNLARMISLEVGNLAARVDITAVNESDALMDAAEDLGGVATETGGEDIPW